MINFKKIFSLILVSVLSTSIITGCGSDKNTNDLENVKQNGVLKIGYTVYEPMNYVGKDGELTGFDTDFAKAVCDELGVKPEFVLINWSNKNIELNSKNIDCIWNGFTITEEMKENVDFSQPYVENKQVLVVNKDNAEIYKSTKDLKGKTVAVEAGSAGYSVASSDENIADTIMTVQYQTDALMELKTKNVDAAIFDNTLAQNMIGDGTDFENLVISSELVDEQYAIGFRKDSNLREEVDKCIDKLRENGSLTALADQYGLKLAN